MIFEDLMDRFKWYPKPFTLSIFCKDKESMNIFEREIDANGLNFNKSKTERIIRYRGIWQRIDIYLMDDKASFCRACRANAIIFDSSFPYDVITEILMSLANIEPNYGCFPFQRGALKKDLKGIRDLPNYEIDLED
jgi:hypothetical protein